MPEVPSNVQELPAPPDEFFKNLRIKPPSKPEPTHGEVAAVTVKPPSWLSRRGKKIFRDLTQVIADLSILDPADFIALSMLADALDDYRIFGEKVEEDGPTFKSTANREGEVLIKANPAVSMKADAWRRVQSGLAKFGLQPKARDGIKLPKPKEKNRFDDDW